MKTKYLAGVALLLAACSGQATNGGAAENTAQLKRAAAEAAAAGGAAPQAPDTVGATPAPDPCAVHGWYGDKVCDSFCPHTDTDCVPDGTSTVCAQFIEQANGICSRKPDDPCIFQDPDCEKSVPPTPTGDCGTSSSASSPPSEGVVCALFAEVSDGVCSRSTSDACRFQDPDCHTEMPTPSPTCYPGTDGAVSSGGSGSNPGVACPALAEVANGICDRPADDPCRTIDPDCAPSGVACALYVEVSDGVCRRPATDPCIAQDPDCVAQAQPATPPQTP